MGILGRQWVPWKTELFETFHWNRVRIDLSSRLQCGLAIHCLGSQWSLPALQPFVPLSRNILWSAWLWRLSRTYSKSNGISLPFDHMYWSKDRFITHVVPAKAFPETFKLGSGTFFWAWRCPGPCPLPKEESRTTSQPPRSRQNLDAWKCQYPEAIKDHQVVKNTGF